MKGKVANHPMNPFWVPGLSLARAAPRCGARNRVGNPCQAPAMSGRRRCRLHGGKATGAKTEAGIERIRQANTKHGRRSKETILWFALLRAMSDLARRTIKDVA